MKKQRILTTEEIIAVLESNAKNLSLFNNDQIARPHKIEITGVYEEDADEKKTAMFLLRSKPSDAAKAVGVQSQKYIRVMVTPVTETEQEGIRPKGKGVAHNVFENTSDLYNLLKAEIIAVNYMLTTAKRDKLPTAKLNEKVWGKIVTVNVPNHFLTTTNAEGAIVKFEGGVRDPHTGEYSKQANQSTAKKFFIEEGDLEGNIRDITISKIKKEVAPYLVEVETVIKTLGGIQVDIIKKEVTDGNENKPTEEEEETP